MKVSEITNLSSSDLKFCPICESFMARSRIMTFCTSEKEKHLNKSMVNYSFDQDDTVTNVKIVRVDIHLWKNNYEDADGNFHLTINFKENKTTLVDKASDFFTTVPGIIDLDLKKMTYASVQDILAFI